MNSVTMTEAHSTSSGTQSIILRDLSNPTEPMYQKIHLGLRFEDPNSPETISDDQLPVETNEGLMDQLKNDFQDILHLQVKVVKPSSTTESTSSFSLCLSAPAALEESYSGYHGPSPKEVRDLRSIAKKMSAKGRLDKLINVYVTERKSFINAHFRKYWDEKLGVSHIQRLHLGAVEAKIILWTRAVNRCLRKIFPLEKQLSNYVFKGLGNGAAGEACFLAIVTEYVNELLDFADALSYCRRSPEKLLKILVLYRSLLCFRSNMNSFFESEVENIIRVRADCILSRLGEVVRLTLSDFEDSLRRELCNYPIPGGAIHSSTKYVIDYVSSLVLESKEILGELITSGPSVSVGDLMVSELEVRELEARTPLAAHLLWVIIVLRLNLDSKSKYYQDPLLGNLFVMNNVYYIVQQIRGSAVLTEMIGENYLNKLTDDVRQSMASYVSGSWDALIYCLRHDGLKFSWGISFGSGVSRKTLKERFKNFNTLFKGIHQTQMMWEVPDHELRTKLHQSILVKLLPPYRNFLGKFSRHIKGGKHPERYIMYSAEELRTKVLKLFSYCSYL